MGKRGFTLIELLAVVVLIGVVMGIALPSVTGINKMIKKSMLNSKIKFIEEASVLYGEDYLDNLKDRETYYNGYKCLSVIASDLVPNYLDSDNDNYCLTKDSSLNVGCLVDPSSNNNYLDKLEIIIYLKDNEVKAVANQDNSLLCS